MSVRSSSFRSKRQRNKRLKHAFYKYGGIGLGILSIFFSLVFITRADFIKVKGVDVFGTEIVNKASIEEIAEQELGAKSFWVFPKSNFLLFPRNSIEKKIRNQFTTVADVSVSFEGLSKLLVNVVEYKPAYLWCNSVVREKCYFMDNRGYIFTESADFSSGVLFTYYGRIDDAEPIGKTYLPEQKFKELNGFVDSLKLLKMSPIGLNSLSEDDYEVLLSGGGKVIFSSRETFLTTFENLETVVAEQNKIHTDFLTTLDYIDVRFASKVFVKMRGF